MSEVITASCTRYGRGGWGCTVFVGEQTVLYTDGHDRGELGIDELEAAAVHTYHHLQEREQLRKPTEFGRRVKEARLLQRISLAVLSQRLHQGPAYVSHIEQGYAPPPPESLARTWAYVLGLDIDVLALYAVQRTPAEPEVRETDPAVGIIPDGEVKDNPTWTLYEATLLGHQRKVVQTGIAGIDGASRLLAERDSAEGRLALHGLILENAPGYGAFLIEIERARQVNAEGYGPEDDARYTCNQLVDAAVAYCIAHDADPDPDENVELQPEFYWPWALGSFKPSDDPIRNLVKAGALIAAEIDRRLAAGETP